MKRTRLYPRPAIWMIAAMAALLFLTSPPGVSHAQEEDAKPAAARSVNSASEAVVNAADLPSTVRTPTGSPSTSSAGGPPSKCGSPPAAPSRARRGRAR